MASIQDLPEELLVIILEHLQHPPSTGELTREPTLRAINHVAAVRATNRRFARLADSVIRCIVDERCSLRPTRPSELARWACKVAQHPDRARFIKEIHIKRWPPGDVSSKDFVAPSAEQYTTLIRRAALPPVWAEELLRGLALKSDAAHLALLLIVCPDLEVFCACSTLDDFGPLLKAVIAQCQLPIASSMPCIWSRIQQIELGSEWSITTPADVLPLLNLPRLRRLTVRRLGETGATTNVVPKHPLKNVAPLDLVFEDCFLNGPRIASILASCKPRSLHVRWLSVHGPSLVRLNGVGRCAAQLVSSWEPHLIADVVDAVCEYAPMLEHLYLDSTNLPLHEDTATRSIGSITELTRLRSLCLPLEVLAVDSIRLPALLSTLRVLDCASGEPFDPIVLNQLRTVSTKCPEAVDLITMVRPQALDEFETTNRSTMLYTASEKETPVFTVVGNQSLQT